MDTPDVPSRRGLYSRAGFDLRTALGLNAGKAMKGGVVGDYLRTTQGCTMLDMEPALAAAIRARIESEELGNVEAGALACGVTHSVRVKRAGIMARLAGGAPKDVDHGLMITPEWVFVAMRSDKDESAAVMAFRLRDLEAKDFARSEIALLALDSGVELTGAPLGGLERVTMFVPLAEGPDGDHLKHVLFEAVRVAGGTAPATG